MGSDASSGACAFSRPWFSSASRIPSCATPGIQDLQREDSVTAATHFLQDIIRQRTEMQRVLEYLLGGGEGPLRAAESLMSSTSTVFLTGLGASWNAALCAGSLFLQNGRPVYMQEAGELLHFTALPPGSVVIALSRTGRSIEIVQLLAKAAAAGIPVVGITNSADSPLAHQAEVALVVPTPLDHAISVNAYSSLLIAAGALAYPGTTGVASVGHSLLRTFEKAGTKL